MRFFYSLMLIHFFFWPARGQESGWYVHDGDFQLHIQGKLPYRLVFEDAQGQWQYVQTFQAEYQVQARTISEDHVRLSFTLQDMQVQLYTRSIVTANYAIRSVNTQGIQDKYVPGFTREKQPWAFQDTLDLVVRRSTRAIVQGQPVLMPLAWIESGNSKVLFRDSLSLSPLLTPLDIWSQQPKLFRELKENNDSNYLVEYFDARRRDCWLINILKPAPQVWNIEHNHVLDVPAAAVVSVGYELTEKETKGVNIRSALPYRDAQVMVNTYGQLPADTGLFFEQGKPVDGVLPITDWTELNVWVKYLPEQKTFNRRVLVKPGMTLRVICDTAYAGVNIEFSALQAENDLLDTLHRRYRGNRIYQHKAYFQELQQRLGDPLYFDTLRFNERAELALLQAYKPRIQAKAYDRFKAEITFFYGQKFYDLFGMPRAWTRDEDAEFFHIQKFYDQIDLEQSIYRTIPAYYDFLEQKFEHYRLNLPGRKIGDWYLPARLSTISAYYSSKDFYTNFPKHYLMTTQVERCISDFNLDISSLQWILEDYRSQVSYRPFLDRVERAYQYRKKLSPGGYLPDFRAYYQNGSAFSAQDDLEGNSWLIGFIPAYQTQPPWQHLPKTEEPLKFPWLLITENRVEDNKWQAWQQEADSLGIRCTWVFLDSLRDDFVNQFSISAQRMVLWPMLVDAQSQIMAVSPFNSTNLNEAIQTIQREEEKRRQKWYRTLLGYGFALVNVLVIYLFIKRLFHYNEDRLRQQKSLQDNQQNQRWLDKLVSFYLQKSWSGQDQDHKPTMKALWQHTRYKEVELGKEMALLQQVIKSLEALHFSCTIEQTITNAHVLIPSGFLVTYLLAARDLSESDQAGLVKLSYQVTESSGIVLATLEFQGINPEKLKTHPLFIENATRLKTLHAAHFHSHLRKDTERNALVLTLKFTSGYRL